MPASFYIPFLVVGMLLTGSCNSLWSKWQDMQCVENCNDPNPRSHILYEQPIWQTLQMFLGEMLCFLPVVYAWIKQRRSSQPVQLSHDNDEQPQPLHQSSDPDKPQPLKGWLYLWLWLPAACDLTGTTLMNIGLLYTPVSIYQMTRGALVLFVGSFSVIFLHRRLWLYQWVSLLVVVGGVSLVGYSGTLIKDAIKEVGLFLSGAPTSLAVDEQADYAKVAIGVSFVLAAQIFSATQFILEEKIMTRYTVAPDIAVGFEGFFGAITILLSFPFIAASPLSDPTSPSYHPFFDLARGWHQMIYTPTVLYSGIAIAFSISFFNWFGLSMTKHLSATTRTLTDSCRTLTIWLVSLGLGWEKLLWPISLLQITGFGSMVYGTLLFNGLVKPPPFLRSSLHSDTPVSSATIEQEEEARHLLAEHNLDETAALPSDLGQSGFDVVPPPTQGQPSTKKVRSD